MYIFRACLWHNTETPWTICGTRHSNTPVGSFQICPSFASSHVTILPGHYAGSASSNSSSEESIELLPCVHSLWRSQTPLQHPYSGPYKVLQHFPKYFIIAMATRIRSAFGLEHTGSFEFQPKHDKQTLPPPTIPIQPPTPAPEVRKTRSGWHVHWPARYVQHHVLDTWNSYPGSNRSFPPGTDLGGSYSSDLNFCVCRFVVWGTPWYISPNCVHCCSPLTFGEQP